MFPIFKVGELIIPSFPLVVAFSSSLCLLWLHRRAANAQLSRQKALDLGLVILVAGFIGARLLHMLWEAPTYYWQDPTRAWDLQSGGFVYYGGALLAAWAGWFFLRLGGKPVSYPLWLDVLAPVFSLGTGLGRLGCFFAGCCFGGACDLPWAVPMGDEHGIFLWRHPVPLYLVAWELGSLLILLGLERTPPGRRTRWLQAPGSLFWFWLVLHGTGRFITEFWRADFRGPQWGLSISQWLSLAIGLLAILVMSRRRSNPTVSK